MNVNQGILRVSETLKPILKKIFPKKLLQKIKQIFVERNYNQMVNSGRETV